MNNKSYDVGVLKGKYYSAYMFCMNISPLLPFTTVGLIINKIYPNQYIVLHGGKELGFIDKDQVSLCQEK